MGVKTNVSRTLASASQVAPSWPIRIRDAVVNLLLPPQCTFCLAPFDMAAGEHLLCADCRRKLDAPAIRCPTCALPAPALVAADGRCGGCRHAPPAFAAARVLGSYQDAMRQSVLKIKHAWYEPLAMALGRLLAERIEQTPLPARPDYVVAVPMHWRRRMWRGTNSAQTLAETIAARLAIPLAGRLVRCIRMTEKQSSLPVSERQKNVRGAYAVSRARNIAGKTILVVDDVITTAATCDEVARVLKRAGAEQVYAAAVARTGGL
jgi:ComF family protein